MKDILMFIGLALLNVVLLVAGMIILFFVFNFFITQVANEVSAIPEVQIMQ